MVALASVRSRFSEGSSDQSSIAIPSSKSEIKSLSHCMPRLLSSGRTFIVPDALNPKVHEGNFVSGAAFILTCPWGKLSDWRKVTGTPFSLPPPVGAWEALTLVFSSLYHFQLQGEMLNIKRVLIGSETASKKETLDGARLNFTLYHSSPFISLPPHSLHK